MKLFGWFKKKKSIELKTEGGFSETERMRMHREEITKNFEGCMNRISNVHHDKSMTPEEKYATMLASLFMIRKITDDVIEDQGLFKDKQYKHITDIATKRPNERASYIG